MEERDWLAEAAGTLSRLGGNRQNEYLYAFKFINVFLDWNHGYIPTICPKDKIPLNDEHVAIKMVNQIYDEVEKFEQMLRFKSYCIVKLGSYGIGRRLQLLENKINIIINFKFYFNCEIIIE